MVLRRDHMYSYPWNSSTADTRPLWRMAFFLYLDGVWEWAQVTSDHVANHYTALAHAYATTNIISNTSTSVEYSTSNRVLPCSYSTFCSIVAQGRATTHPEDLIRNVKVHPGSLDPPSSWNTWEEYLQSKTGEFTPDQIVAVMTQNWLKLDRTMARILEMFDWYSTSRLAAVIGHFEHQLGVDNPHERWR